MSSVKQVFSLSHTDHTAGHFVSCSLISVSQYRFYCGCYLLVLEVENYQSLLFVIQHQFVFMRVYT